MSELYIGLMSGTSIDGIDAVLVDFSHLKPKILAKHFEKMPDGFRESILNICYPGENEINKMGELDVELGKQFAKTVNILLTQTNISPKLIRAIGSHGQTIRHHPNKQFTIQIGDPNIIAAQTHITTIADFRRRDMAEGGQGAPLVPAFHKHFFYDKKVNRIILNIGGIANITVLLADSQNPVIGFDTGPGNTLIDAWTQLHLNKSCDENGVWASEGSVNQPLLSQMLKDSFFNLPHPKSTGREYFNLNWLKSFSTSSIKPQDMQATLVELTVTSIINSVKKHMSEGDILVCGGGIHNEFLMKRLRELGSNYHISSTLPFGIDPDWVEATAFAWLAKQTLNKQPGNLSAVTGANKEAILGGIYFA